jgi:hypothetical protein
MLQRMSDIGVQVDSRSIDKAMRDTRSGLWLHFRTDDCTMDDLGDVLEQANGPYGTDGTYGEGPWKTPTGHVLVVHPADSDNFDDWIARIAAGLEDLGVTGTFEGTKPTYVEEWPTEDPTPAAYLAWAQDFEAVTADPNRGSHWHVPLDATERILQHAAAWTKAGGDQAIVYMGIFPLAVSPEADVFELMNSSLINNYRTASTRYQSDEKRGRSAFLKPGGAAVMQEIGASVPWQQRLEALQQAFETLPSQYLDLAFIRPAPKQAHSWQQIDIRQKRDPHQKLPDLHESDIRYNRHLLSQYAPDAHGIQILTDQHLSRARDLSSWNIRDLSHDRYLVEAQDFAPWYSRPLPDQDIVDKARDDFGDMILTKETIAANPPPWRPAA